MWNRFLKGNKMCQRLSCCGPCHNQSELVTQTNKQSNKNLRSHTKQQFKEKINEASLKVLSEGDSLGLVWLAKCACSPDSTLLLVHTPSCTCTAGSRARPARFSSPQGCWSLRGRLHLQPTPTPGAHLGSALRHRSPSLVPHTKLLLKVVYFSL